MRNIKKVGRILVNLVVSLNMIPETCQTALAGNAVAMYP